MDAHKRERLWRAIEARSLLAAPDLDLLDRWRAGKLEAGEELCRRYFDRLRGFFATKCGGDAVELVQRTLRASIRAEEPRPESFRTYLFMLARHELHRHLQQRRRRGVDLSIASIAELLADEGR